MSSSTLAAARDRLSEQLVITQIQFLCFSLKHCWNEFSGPNLHLPCKTCSLFNLAADGKQLCKGKNIARCHSCNNAYTWEWRSATKTTTVKRPGCQSGNGVTCIFFKTHQWYFLDNQEHSLRDVQNHHYMEKLKLVSAVTNTRKIVGAETQPP